MGIVLDNVCFSYGNRYIFKNVNLELKSNVITGIVGKSGSGKTTLLEIISGLLKPTKGKVLIDYVDINKIDYRRNIGIVFQNPENSFFNIYVKEELEFALKNFNINVDLIEFIKLVGLKEDILNKKLDELSSGEKRLIAILSVLVYNPKIILLDEPTINLDYSNKKKVISLIKKLKKSGKTILIVSHDVNMLYELCDNIIALSRGNIILYGDTMDVFNEIKLLKKYDISIPSVVLFENYALEKDKKLLKSKNVNDLIKEIYRNV